MGGHLFFHSEEPRGRRSLKASFPHGTSLTCGLSWTQSPAQFTWHWLLEKAPHGSPATPFPALCGSLLSLTCRKPAVKGSITQPIFNSLPLPLRSVFSLTLHLTPLPLAKMPSSFLRVALIYPGAMTWKDSFHCLTFSHSAQLL